ncbi:MAG: P-loop NTPase [Candidatus Kapaibacteriota bacterium]|jgi:ATP-binding protein involved in chromosome partitioning
MNEHIIRDVIDSIQDPDLGYSLKDLSAIKAIEIDGMTISLYIELYPPIHWIAKSIEDEIRSNILKISEGYEIRIYVREIISPRATNPNVLPTVKHLIAVSSGKGGVGKSTIAANLAAALAQRGASVGLLDADIYGPSIPTMYGVAGAQMEAEKTESGALIGYPIEQYGVKIASIGFIMDRDQAAIMRGPMLAGYFTTLMDQIAWGDLDFLVFDLPPGTGDIQLTLTQRVPLDGSVIVTTPQEISVSDVRRSISMFKKVNVNILGIIENMSYFIPPDDPEKQYHIFGKGGGEQVAKDSNIPFLGAVPLTIDTREGGDNGFPVVLNPEYLAQGDIIRDITSSIVSMIRKNAHNSRHSQTISITL